MSERTADFACCRNGPAGCPCRLPLELTAERDAEGEGDARLGQTGRTKRNRTPSADALLIRMDVHARTSLLSKRFIRRSGKTVGGRLFVFARRWFAGPMGSLANGESILNWNQTCLTDHANDLLRRFFAITSSTNNELAALLAERNSALWERIANGLIQ